MLRELTTLLRMHCLEPLVKLFLSSVYSVSSEFLNCFLGAPVAEPKVEMGDAEDWNGGG